VRRQLQSVPSRTQAFLAVKRRCERLSRHDHSFQRYRCLALHKELSVLRDNTRRGESISTDSSMYWVDSWVFGKDFEEQTVSSFYAYGLRTLSFKDAHWMLLLL
jgi:hypothetical protein